MSGGCSEVYTSSFVRARPVVVPVRQCVPQPSLAIVELSEPAGKIGLRLPLPRCVSGRVPLVAAVLAADPGTVLASTPIEEPLSGAQTERVEQVGL